MGEPELGDFRFETSQGVFEGKGRAEVTTSPWKFHTIVTVTVPDDLKYTPKVPREPTEVGHVHKTRDGRIFVKTNWHQLYAGIGAWCQVNSDFAHYKKWEDIANA